MAEMDENWTARLVDDQLRFVRGEGPEPDLSELSDIDRVEMVEVLNLIDALVDSRPLSPSLEEDPVAIRLGLVVGESVSSPEESGESRSADPVVVTTEELRYRFAGAVEVESLALLGDEGWCEPVAVCRALAENVLVMTFQPGVRTPSADDARSLLLDDPSLTAIAFTTPDAIDAAVVVPGDAVGQFVPAEGWRPPGDLIWGPLGIVLGGYFDRSIPHWDAVSSLPRQEVLDELNADVGVVVSDVLHAVALSRPQLEHKRRARDFVASADPAIMAAWANDVRLGRKSAADVVSAIDALCQEATP
jgi:hypothetical protein